MKHVEKIKWGFTKSNTFLVKLNVFRSINVSSGVHRRAESSEDELMSAKYIEFETNSYVAS
jgi:hypothetical protein